MKSYATGVYIYKTLSEIFNDICNKLGLLCTTVDTKYVISYLFFENDSYFDVLKEAISQTKIMTGIEYVFSVQNGKITLKALQENAVIYEVTDDNMLYFEEYVTNDNVINYVEVYQLSTGSIYSKYVEKNESSINSYGIISKSIKVNKGYTASECKKIARSYVDELSNEEHYMKIKVIADKIINIGDVIKVKQQLYLVTQTDLAMSNDKDVYTLYLTFWRVYE